MSLALSSFTCVNMFTMLPLSYCANYHLLFNDGTGSISSTGNVGGTGITGSMGDIAGMADSSG